MQSNQDVINRWSVSAPFWEKHHGAIRQMFAPITQALVEDAQVVSGHAVLDVACGSGEPGLSVAAQVGPSGKVVGVDPIPEMVAGAGRAAERQGLKNIRFEVAFADALPFPDNTFDAVISRFGVMFFPAPVDAIREMLRVLKPGRKLALAVWGFAARNPFHFALSNVVDRFAEPAPIAPDAPDAFRFAAPGALLEIFKQAGVVDARERLLQFKIEAPVSMEEFWTLRCEMSEMLRTRIATLSAAQMAELKRQAFEAFREYRTGSGMSFPGEVLVVSGGKRDRE